MMTDRPGGFSTDDLGHIYEIMPALSRLIEMHYVRRTAVTLLDTYLGKQTGQKVLNGQVRRGDGDNIYSVIWFCDLRNSTALSETMAREDFLVMLNQFLEAMADAVLDAGGEVLRYIGDAALAIFPIAGDIGLATPVATKKALEAAKDAIERMKIVNAERVKNGENEIGFGIGLHLGEVTYGNIGSPNRLEFTVIGAAANEAARLENLTKEVGVPIVISENFNSCSPSKLKSLDRKALRNVEGDQEIFTLPDL
ncbi:MAG: adenylate/guanylate cyclase domain-containing protein [Rhodospirillales bacterium]